MLSRVVVTARSAPQLSAAAAVAARRYSSSTREGSVAQSREFGKKEKAHEDKYIREHELSQLRKLREQIEAAKKHLESLESEHASLDKEVKSKE